MVVFIMRYTWTALCVIVVTMSGSVKSEEASVRFEFILDITNRIYNDSLLKNDSADYKHLFSQVNTTLYSIYGCTSCSTHSFYRNVSKMTFSNENGNVLVNATLVFGTMKDNADMIKGLFTNATAVNNEKNSLKFDPKFTQVSQSNPESPATSTSHPIKTAATHPTEHPTEHPTDHTAGHPTDHTAGHPADHLTTKHHNAACNQTGTVLVKATLTFKSNETDARLVESLLLKAVNGSNEINYLKFKPEFSEGHSEEWDTKEQAQRRD
ncbi:uncharacterized protein LOC113662835 [Tachysurus fulvidraco]|uniref:uncharacterized protein LOC113662835 n=1 Tax=Tachysurus fulvidraco TaxID=1234273 RepID=UPI001FF030D9|nr:uncharacterized protein LOC113662835 [Tachysurus fulvidraco]